MTLGRGLESLIPSQPHNTNASENPAAGESQQQFTPPARQAFESVPASQETEEYIQKEPEQRVPTQEQKPEISEPKRGDAIFHIEINNISPNPFQPRREYNEQDLKDLAQSIREVGILQPLVVSKIENETSRGTKTTYQLISGERRFRAAQLLGMEEVPVVIREVPYDRDKLSLALIENIQRSDLNPLETARAYARLQDEFNITQREIATKVGKSRESVANTLRLLNLPSEIQDAIAEGRINESQGRTLLSVQDPQEQQALFQQLLEKGFSTRRLRSQARRIQQQPAQKSREDTFWERQLEEKLGSPVELKRNGGVGKIVIRFFSLEEWHRIRNTLLNNKEDY